MENYQTASVPTSAAPVVTHLGARVKQRAIGAIGAASRFANAPFRSTDDDVPGIPVWSPPV